MLLTRRRWFFVLLLTSFSLLVTINFWHRFDLVDSQSLSSFFLSPSSSYHHRFLLIHNLTYQTQFEQVDHIYRQLNERQFRRHYKLSQKNRPWFMSGGFFRPDPKNQQFSQLTIYPWHDNQYTDRIVNQLMYIPFGYNSTQLLLDGNVKRILVNLGTNHWSNDSPPLGRRQFIDDKCPVNTCEVVHNENLAGSVDAILFKDRFKNLSHKRPTNQIWILYLLECPLNTPKFKDVNKINWTATYRHDSDIVAPYEKFVYFDPNIKSKPIKRNYAEGKKKKVAWFVSNCNARNKRLQYAKELSKYIDVDIYGSCGRNKCSRGNHEKCFELLSKNYKFYLAFENSNCRDYITEKLYDNALNHAVVPIVMGAHPDDYERHAPHHSYIHVDQFDSPESLAQYLHIIDKNDHLYNSYFEWRETGQFINTFFWCRLCAMLHSPLEYRNYGNLSHWWHNDRTCRNEHWM